MDFTINKKQLLGIGLLSAAFFLLYRHTILMLVSDWSTDPNFSHGFLIPAVTLYMVWTRKNELSELIIKPSFIGFSIILAGMMFHIVGNVGSEFFFMRISMLITLTGIVIFLYGMPVFRVVVIPICYLILMIPIPSILWNKVAFPLQMLSASLSSEVIYTIGIPVFREGNILHLSNTSLEVVDACSGIRSLTSLLAISGAFSYISTLHIINKWVLFISAIPIAVFVNIVRLTITAIMAAYIGPETAHGFLHDMSGLLVFIAALGSVYVVFLGLSKI